MPRIYTSAGEPLDLTNQGGFYPKVINAALDRLTILAQQNAEQISRSVKVPISSSVTSPGLVFQTMVCCVCRFSVPINAISHIECARTVPDNRKKIQINR